MDGLRNRILILLRDEFNPVGFSTKLNQILNSSYGKLKQEQTSYLKDLVKRAYNDELKLDNTFLRDKICDIVIYIQKNSNSSNGNIKYDEIIKKSIEFVERDDTSLDIYCDFKEFVRYKDIWSIGHPDIIQIRRKLESFIENGVEKIKFQEELKRYIVQYMLLQKF